jgi:hypothetical protein
MRSSGRSRKRPWWSRWSLEVSHLVPSIVHGIGRTLLFLGYALVFIAIAVPPTLPRIVLGALTVLGLNVALLVAASRLGGAPRHFIRRAPPTG